MKKEELKEIIGEAIGEASMCWSEVPEGIFLSDRAVEMTDIVMKSVEEYAQAYVESVLPERKRMDIGVIGAASISLKQGKKSEVWFQDARKGFNAYLDQIKSNMKDERCMTHIEQEKKKRRMVETLIMVCIACVVIVSGFFIHFLTNTSFEASHPKQPIDITIRME